MTGRPPTRLTDCQEIHEGLLNRGWAGLRVPRKQWDAVVAQLAGCSAPTARVLTETGRLHGLWTVASGRGPGNGGHVVLMAPAHVAASVEA